LNPEHFFEVKSCDLAGRIGNLRTKSSQFETPALLPVIHPLRQSISCKDIQKMGYDAVMTNAYTIYSKLGQGPKRGVHEILDFKGSIMTDSGGYQVLEFGSVDVSPEEMARHEEQIGSDIAIVLDKPTGIDVTRNFAKETVDETLRAARLTRQVLTRDDMLWTLPIQGGKYLDLVRRSAKLSSTLDYDCYALGSPVEVMEEYDFSLLVSMIVTAKKNLPANKPFHLFGAGHPLILPLAVALGCDMFDSASYMLYAKKDRYISTGGTIRLAQLEYLGCSCEVCSSYTANELRKTEKEERTVLLARHNLAALQQTMRDTKQAIWEGRLWELISTTTRKHPKSFEAYGLAVESYNGPNSAFDSGTPRFKERGLFILDEADSARPEVARHRSYLKNIDLKQKSTLLILPETRTKPFLKSDIFEEVSKIVSRSRLSDSILTVFVCPNYGLVPAELSDVYPLSQTMAAIDQYPEKDFILNSRKWGRICLLATNAAWDKWGGWMTTQLSKYLKVDGKKIRISSTPLQLSRRVGTRISRSKSYRSYKKMISSL
jgi:7-cyano-7-deazaguanine tRNA-ribosyltransferase